MNTVRDGKLVSVTCPSCGCRLRTVDDGWRWTHFHVWDNATNMWSENDARGCKCEFTYAGLVFRFPNPEPLMHFTGPFSDPIK